LLPVTKLLYNLNINQGVQLYFTVQEK